MDLLITHLQKMRNKEKRIRFLNHILYFLQCAKGVFSVPPDEAIKNTSGICYYATSFYVSSEDLNNELQVILNETDLDFYLFGGGNPQKIIYKKRQEEYYFDRYNFLTQRIKDVEYLLENIDKINKIKKLPK